MKGSLAFIAVCPNDFRLPSITTRPKTRLKSMPCSIVAKTLRKSKFDYDPREQTDET